jgi:hypothetical protein
MSAMRWQAEHLDITSVEESEGLQIETRCMTIKNQQNGFISDLIRQCQTIE